MRARVRKALKSWDGLIAQISTMTEQELASAIKIEQEREGGGRKEHLLRMHRRLKRLERERERKELLG